MVQTGWKSEFHGLWTCLRTHSWIVLLFPFFLASNWVRPPTRPPLLRSDSRLTGSPPPRTQFYTYQFNVYNGAGFTLRTRSLNAMLYYFGQILASLAFGAAMDTRRFRRVNKAWAGLALITVLVIVTNGCAYYYQK